ncbi:hypothetical protein [Rhodospirillum sp. A1_3_36]|uniref:hypothetical protein n=1 Tax=Rhodospirillum sp. A1_3_36 TaxID=3391666 RepID=UPI0039A68071
MTINLGDPVNLLAGLESHFPGPTPPWRVPPNRPVIAEASTPPSGPVVWEEPTLTLHDTPQDLVNHILDISVIPMVGLDGPLSLGAGTVMDPHALATLGARLSLDLTERPAAAFLLARLRGRRGTLYYTPEWEGLNRKHRILRWLTAEGRRALARLRVDELRQEGHEFHGDVTARQAARYLSYFQDFGTHVVRSLTYGEQLFQVFAVRNDLLPALRETLPPADAPLQGAIAHGMIPFTRAPWTVAASPILTATPGPESHEIVTHPLWYDIQNDASGGPNLLARAAQAPEARSAALDRLPATSVIGVTLACQALYLEDHRADAWSRLLRAALALRFPHAQRVGWRDRRAIQPVPLLASAGLPALGGPSPAFPSPNPHSPSPTPHSPSLDPPPLALALDVSAPGAITGGPEPRLALFTTTNPGSGRAAERMIDDGSPGPEDLIFPAIDGALLLKGQGGARACLVEGAWIGLGKENKPVVLAAPQEPDPTILLPHVAGLLGYLRLLDAIQPPLFSPETNRPMGRCADWLVKVTAKAQDPSLQTLHHRAHQVAWGVGRLETAPDTTLSPGLLEALSNVLEGALGMLTAPITDPGTARRIETQETGFREVLRGLPGSLAIAPLETSLSIAETLLEQRIIRLAETPGLAPFLAEVLSMGRHWTSDPNPEAPHHRPMPGETPEGQLWNAFLAIKACHAESRAILAAIRGRADEAKSLLARTWVTGRTIPQDPTGIFLSALGSIWTDATRPAEPEWRGLAEDLVTLDTAVTAARRLHHSDPPKNRDGGPMDPGLHRLVIVLELLALCHRLGLSSAPLDSLAPAALSERLNAALLTSRKTQPRRNPL